MIINKLSNKTNTPIALALGFFDSVHIGHKAVIQNAVNFGKKNGIKSAVLTFENNPLKLLGRNEGLILTFEERQKKLEAFGLDIILYENFDNKFMQQDKTVFLDELTKNHTIKYVVCGQDYRFGKFGEGDAQYLSNYFINKGIKYEVMDFVVKDGNKISSSLIRLAISDGNVRLAKVYLDEPYSISGVVVRGRGEGGRLGKPTINIDFPSEKIKPAYGVYVTKTDFDNQSYLSVTSVGGKPTFGIASANIETFLIDYNGDLYGKKVKIKFYEFLRKNVKFDSALKLTEQINKDIQDAIKYMEKII